jgi:replicative DNA helicase
MGLATGFKRLDQILNGFNAGLHVLAAGPGAGKTTLALQWANVATQAGAAVLYVTYENSPANLVLKLLASVAGISGVEIERGYGDMRKIEEASRKLEPALSRLAILEGNSKLSLAQIHSRVRQTQEAQGREDVLVVVDYLQRAAHQKGYDQLRHSVSAIAGELREMANQCGVPVLAISSQNRAGGDYGRNAGSVPNLDSLKESGDLEYAADTAMFLCPEPDVKVTAPARAMKLVVLKNRFGGIGSVPLIFRPDTGVYREAQQGILGQG